MKCWEEDLFGSRNSSSTISSNSSTNNNGSMKRLCVVARGDGIVSVLDLDGTKNGTKSSSSSKKNKSSGKKKSGSATPLQNFSAIHLGEAMKEDGSRFGHTHACSYAQFYLGTKVQRSSLAGWMEK